MVYGDLDFNNEDLEEPVSVIKEVDNLDDEIFKEEKFISTEPSLYSIIFEICFEESNGIVQLFKLCSMLLTDTKPKLNKFDKRGRSNSNLFSRLFPDITDARLRLKDLEDYIMSLNYLELQDEDVVMLIQLVFMLKGLHGRDVKTGILATIYKLDDNIDYWNLFAWGTYF
uniref:DUF1985 domain-containing protein n=1 Tax=Lactuca sativa TaxID=4236 RepID=A0A9R1XCL5_LACSA|nr:hypothetical protein LSAT_V11C500268800 [Lactuca sativa]